jgi:hypothetical protein
LISSILYNKGGTGTIQSVKLRANNLKTSTKLGGAVNQAVAGFSSPRPGFSQSTYSKTCLKRNLKGPEHFSVEARFPFNQGILR